MSPYIWLLTGRVERLPDALAAATEITRPAADVAADVASPVCDLRIDDVYLPRHDPALPGIVLFVERARASLALPPAVIAAVRALAARNVPTPERERH